MLRLEQFQKYNATACRGTFDVALTENEQRRLQDRIKEFNDNSLRQLLKSFYSIGFQENGETIIFRWFGSIAPTEQQFKELLLWLELLELSESSTGAHQAPAEAVRHVSTTDAALARR